MIRITGAPAGRILWPRRGGGAAAREDRPPPHLNICSNSRAISTSTCAHPFGDADTKSCSGGFLPVRFPSFGERQTQKGRDSPPAVRTGFVADFYARGIGRGCA
ncbi:unnamed protein product, partial [Iphiclides podalirius]